jgi:hypothetical protein
MKILIFYLFLFLFYNITFAQKVIEVGTDSCGCRYEVIDDTIEIFMPQLKDSTMLCKQLKQHIYFKTKPKKKFEAISRNYYAYINSKGILTYIKQDEFNKNTYGYTLFKIEEWLKTLQWIPAYKNDGTKGILDTHIDIYFRVYSFGKVEMVIKYDNAYQEKIYTCWIDIPKK